MLFHSRSSGRKVTQGLSTSMNENPGCWIASTNRRAVPFGSPENPDLSGNRRLAYCEP